MIEDFEDAEALHHDAMNAVMKQLKAWLFGKRKTFYRSANGYRKNGNNTLAEQATASAEAIDEVLKKIQQLRKEQGETSAERRYNWYVQNLGKHLPTDQMGPNDPTLEEIQEATRKLQEEWTESERQRRAGMEPQAMEFDRVLYPSRVF